MILALFLIYIFRSQKKIKNLNRQLNIKAENLNQANHEKDMLLAVVSHQVKAPLANIMYFLDMSGLLIKEGNIGELSKFLGSLGEAMKSSYQRALDVLEWMKIANRDDLSEEELCLKNLVEEVIDFHKEDLIKKELNPKINIGNIALLKTKKEGIKIIFQNLIENAIKYSERGGEITISDNNSSESRQLNITNNNSVDLAQKTTARSKSTGMGLVIVKDLCAKLNIKLSFHNSNEQTRVSLEFS